MQSMKFSSGTKDKNESVLLSTAYLPPISCIAACVHPEVIRIELHETYPKQTFRNHCVILGPNGKQVLSVPVIKTNGNRTQTKDVRISGSIPWQRLHWRSIATAYSNSPYFLYYQDYFLPVYEKRFESLTELNEEFLGILFRILKLRKKVTHTHQFLNGEGESDLRFHWMKRSPLPPAAFPEYTQVFSSRHGFMPDLSIIDLIFNLGPEAMSYLENLPAF
jgi:hypothetical protein